MNQRSSPLLRLPTELRDKIYGYIFSDYLMIVGSSGKISFQARGQMGLVTLGSIAASLLSINWVCRQFRAETEALSFQQYPATERIAGYGIRAAIGDRITKVEVTFGNNQQRLPLPERSVELVERLSLVRLESLQSIRFLFHKHNADRAPEALDVIKTVFDANWKGHATDFEYGFSN